MTKELDLAGKKIGFAITGSHCMLAEVMKVMLDLRKRGGDLTIIISASVRDSDTKFGRAANWRQQAEEISGKALIDSIVDAEPIGPEAIFDILVIAPCSGNTIAKLANGITDSAVLMAAKAHLRNQRPVLVAISSNDALGMNLRNIGCLLNSKNIYFVPFGQDNYQLKANSLVADMSKIGDAAILALAGRQIQPLLLRN